MQIYDIAIIGSGPGGISAAIEAKRAGINNIIVLEKSQEHSSTIRKFYKDGKRVDREYKGQIVELKGTLDFQDTIKEDYLKLFDGFLEANSITPKYGVDIERICKKEGFFELLSSANEVFHARFIIIAIGKMGQPNKPDYKIPPSILKKVSYNANGIVGGEKVLVVGGGNSAVEYAIALAKETNTTLNYRKKEFSRINDVNAKALQEALSSNLKSRLGVDIEKLEDDQGKVKVFFNGGESETFDKVIYAIGGAIPTDFLKKSGIELKEDNLPVVKDFESSLEGAFIIGDILYKTGGSIALSISQGYEAICRIKTRI